MHGLFPELAVPIGRSGQITFETRENNEAIYDVHLTVSGLPPGTTAAINPPTISAGQTATVTITASSASTESQNVSVTLTGTPSAPVTPTSTSFLVDVTPPPGFLPNNRTDYISTEGTPNGAVYDPLQGLIFVSNDSWNRIDIISATKQKIVAQIPIRDPRGIDISQDDSTVWVATGSRQMFAIDTTTSRVSRYLLPIGARGYWEASLPLVLADGTVMIALDTGKFTGSSGFAIWNPVSNALSFPNPPFFGPTPATYRSGNGKRVYFIASDTGGAGFYYDVDNQDL